MDELSKALFDFAICIEQFISHFPDEKRAPLTAESVDWDEYIIPYMRGFATMFPSGIAPVEYARALRGLAEVAYCLGYERGKQRIPEVLVAEAGDE